eukprot:350146-Chlamydomonas_euryale.AAC.2
MGLLLGDMWMVWGVGVNDETVVWIGKDVGREYGTGAFVASCWQSMLMGCRCLLQRAPLAEGACCRGRLLRKAFVEAWSPHCTLTLTSVAIEPPVTSSIHVAGL